MNVRCMINNHDEIRMSARPEFYAGRGVQTCDCDSRNLLAMHAAIKKTFGEKEAKAFIEMIAGLQEMSATGVLNALYDLERNGWVPPKETKNTSAEDLALSMKKDDGEYHVNDAACLGMMSLMGFPQDPEFAARCSASIRSNFLDAVGHKREKQQMVCYCDNQGNAWTEWR